MDLTSWHLFKQGAEAKLYTGTFLGQDVVAKERFSKKYRSEDHKLLDRCLMCDHVLFRHPALDSLLTKDRHKAEVRALLKCKQIGVRRLCDEYG